jgi:hypothetical protein
MMVWQRTPNTHAARIVEYLQAHPEGASDGELVKALGVTNPATVNMVCRNLEGVAGMNACPVLFGLGASDVDGAASR